MTNKTKIDSLNQVGGYDKTVNGEINLDSPILYEGSDCLLELNGFDSLLCRVSSLTESYLTVTFSIEDQRETLIRPDTFSKIILSLEKKEKADKELVDKLGNIITDGEADYIADKTNKFFYEQIPISKEMKLYKLYNNEKHHSYTISTTGIHSIKKCRKDLIYSIQFVYSSIKSDENKDYNIYRNRSKINAFMWIDTDFDYNNPDLRAIKELVLNDFSNKVLNIFKEKPYSMFNIGRHWEFEKQFNRFVFPVNDTTFLKKVLTIKSHDYVLNRKTNEQEYTKILEQYVADYISDYMDHTYMGRDIKKPTENDVYKWFGEIEYPKEIIVYLNKDKFFANSKEVHESYLIAHCYFD